MNYQHGGDIYTNEYRLDFSVNINPFGMEETVRKAAEDSMCMVTAYPDPRCRKLREAVAEKLHVMPEDLIFGNGAAEIIFEMVLAEKPKRAIVITPGFAEYEQALKTVDCEIIYYDRKEEENFSLNEHFLSFLNGKMNRNPDRTQEQPQNGNSGIDLVFLCSPDNPTGSVIPSELMKQIIAVCEENGIRLVLDESFIEFVEDRKRDSMISRVQDHTSLFILRSFTKMYGMPGLRLGYGVCRDKELINRMEEMRQPWSVSIPAQAAGIEACKLTGWAESVRDYVKEQRLWMEKQLEELGCRVYPSDANYILFYTEYELMEPLKRKGILIRDCSNYRGLSRGFYRIAVKREEENRDLLTVLRTILKER